MTEDVSWCMRGCQKPVSSEKGAKLVRVQTEDGLTLCDECIEQLERNLKSIRRNYRKLRRHILPGSVDANPEVRAPKNPNAPAPLRLDVVDLTDERHKLTNSTLPVENVRGAVGVLQRWAMTVRIGRGFTIRPDRYTIESELDVLERSWDWVLGQPWTPAMFKDLGKLARRMKDAVGDIRAPVLGTCEVVIVPDDGGDPHVCGGKLLGLFKPRTHVKCVECQTTWDEESRKEQSTIAWLSRTQTEASA